MLFQPLEIQKLLLKNRVVMAPMTRNHSPGGVPTDEVAAYYRRRAEGGVGLIITEGSYIDHPSAPGYAHAPTWKSEALSGWQKVIQEVHRVGGKMITQLWHCGAFRKPDFDVENQIPVVAPSAMVHPGLVGPRPGLLPKALSENEIEDLLQSYARAALMAKEVGFDGIEIHAAHGYLIDQFFWKNTNLRTDRYGGEWADRIRFGVEVTRAIRKAVGPGFPIFFRFSQWKIGGFEARIFENPQELEIFLATLVDAGVDVFHASTRRFDTEEFPGSPLNLAGWTKKLSGKPTITVGSVGLSTDFISERGGEKVIQSGLDRLLFRLEKKEFDLVAVGRALLSDPEWPRKVRDGRWGEIIPYNKSYLEKLA